MYHHLSAYYNLLFPENPGVKLMMTPYIKPGKNAIDLGCGTGRLTHLLDTFGMDVVGIDLDEKMIEVAKKNYPNIQFLHGDMVKILNQKKQYHLITCFGNTLPHLDLTNLKTFLTLVYSSLDKQGVLWIQLLNYSKILKERPKNLKKIVVDSIELTRQYTYYSNHILFKTILSVDGLFTQGSTHIYPYEKEELENEIKIANLKSEAYGNFEFKPFDQDDYYLYLAITKQ